MCQELLSEVSFFVFLVSYVGAKPWWPIQSPTEEERRKRKAKKRESDQIKFIDLRFEKWQVVRFRKAGRKQEVPQIAYSCDELCFVRQSSWIRH